MAKQQSYEELRKKIKESKLKIAKSRKIEKDLLEKKNRLQDLVNNAVVGIYRTTDEGKFLFVNKRLAHIFGFKSPHDLLASVPNVSQLYANPEDRPLILNEMNVRGYVDGAEVQLRRWDGQVIWISISARAIESKSGATVYEGFIIDITERKQAAKSLEESEKRFRTLVEQAGDNFCIHDSAGKIIDVNRQACQTLGYDREEQLNMTIFDFDTEIEKEKHKQRFWDTLTPGRYIAFESVHRRKDGSTFPVEVHLGRLDLGEQKLFLSLVRDITERKSAEYELRKAFEEIKELKNRLEEENISLRQEIEIRYQHEEIVGESPAIKKVLYDAEKVAAKDTCVLIQGETGTGKELLARAIHNMSSRRGRSMVKVNCAALPATLIESELFGREKGAFTGAVSKQVGRFEAARDSTIFLDEIGDLPLELQAKLLKVLQDGEFERLGSSETISVDVRVIAATNHDLANLVQEKKFRRDLYYRLNVFPITVPPLRERRADIPLLVWTFVKELSHSMGKSIKDIPQKTMTLLQNNPWPGNVRELKNVIERAMILTTGSTLSIDWLEAEEVPASQNLTLDEVQRGHIIQILERTGWRVRGRRGAAEMLNLKPTTLEARMKKLSIQRIK